MIFLVLIWSDLKENPRNFWKFINNKRNTSGYPSHLSYLNNESNDSVTISNMFADFFGSAFDCVSDDGMYTHHFEHLQTYDHLGNINMYITSDKVFLGIRTL